MQKTYSMNNITWETPDTVIEGTPVSEIPREILDYYMSNDYGKRGIPLSVQTVKEIAKILGEEESHGQS